MTKKTNNSVLLAQHFADQININSLGAFFIASSLDVKEKHLNVILNTAATTATMGMLMQWYRWYARANENTEEKRENFYGALYRSFAVVPVVGGAVLIGRDANVNEINEVAVHLFEALSLADIMYFGRLLHKSRQQLITENSTAANVEEYDPERPLINNSDETSSQDNQTNVDLSKIMLIKSVVNARAFIAISTTILAGLYFGMDKELGGAQLGFSEKLQKNIALSAGAFFLFLNAVNQLIQKFYLTQLSPVEKWKASAAQETVHYNPVYSIQQAAISSDAADKTPEEEDIHTALLAATNRS